MCFVCVILFYLILSRRAFLKSPENFSDPKSDPKSSRKHFIVFLETHEHFGPEKNRAISPRKFTGGHDQRVPKKFFFREKFVNKMAAAAAVMLPPREKRSYAGRTVLHGMRRNEVIERYRLSPERIKWLVDKFETELERDTNRNFPLSAETQVGNFLFIH